MANAKLRSLWNTYKENKFLIALFLPGFCIFFLFAYVPIYGLQIAFKDFHVLEGVWGSPWVGFDNFQRLFTGHGFTNALRNTIVISLLKYLITFPAPIILALMLNEVRNVMFRRVIQTISYLPHFFSWVILASILFAFLGLNGAVNAIIGLFGFEPVLWLQQPSKFYGILILSDIWAGVGWGSIIYFAALSGIDPTLYEAAIVDGASRWQRLWNVTIPGIMPTILVMLLLSIGSFLSVGFDQIYNLVTPMTSNVGDILDTYVLRNLLSMDYGLGTAAGLFSSVFGLVLIFTTNWLVKRYDRDQGLW
ncbi:ABC transporter permease [Paenibacillus contaminans]|jgi:putative aldouronate transport system permease protein|uniref:Sugar ABC transporter permease n=1 Tax=Paenibacillus contaminans TaxID=450362 RepID=A0A329M289_9BACL|nr:ABC transporter permease subunit [Paenibacillus contaminans]RAV13346.1 sugar ABC transporter permease [Paenibacillus contaminans]